MRTEVEVSVYLDPEEQFDFEYDGVHRRARLVHYRPGSDYATVYGARVYRNGQATSGSFPVRRALSDLPEAVTEALR